MQRFSGDGGEPEASAHTDLFVRNLLAARPAPALRFELPELRYPLRLNAAVALLASGTGDRPALIADATHLSRQALAERVARLADVLVRGLGLRPGNRLIVHGQADAWAIAAVLAGWRAGAIVVCTAPGQGAAPLGHAARSTRASHALADIRHAETLLHAHAPELHAVATWGDGTIEQECARADPTAPACDTAADDPALIVIGGDGDAFVHLHRDLLSVCDSYARHVLGADQSDRFVSPLPLAAPAGLCANLLFPLRCGASVILPAQAGNAALLQAIEAHRASIAIAAPAHFHAIAPHAEPAARLRAAVAAGDLLHAATRAAWHATTQTRLIDGLCSAALLGMFAGDEPATGGPVRATPGHVVRLAEDGALLVQGPTGARTLAGSPPLRGGWTCAAAHAAIDATGHVTLLPAADDAPSHAVEALLMAHPSVEDCGVTTIRVAERTITEAHVVLRAEAPGTRATAEALRRHAAPCALDAIVFVEALPRSSAGRLLRTTLSDAALHEAAEEGRG